MFLELDRADVDEEVDDDEDDEADFDDLSLYVSRSFELGALLVPFPCFSLYSFEDDPPVEPDPPLPEDLLDPFELPPLVPSPEDEELVLDDD